MTLKRFVFLIVGFLFTIEINGQCGTAYVSSDDTVVCVPRIVRFTAHRFPVGTTFEWDLGSGYVSSDSTYTKLYATSGNFNVRLKLKYLDGSTCIIDKVGFIQAKPVPIPAYSISKKVICGYADSVVLTDMSPKTVSRDWLVDNVLYTNGPKVLKSIFRAPNGYKNFTMFMRDSFGCEGKRTFDSAVFIPDSISVNFSANKLSGCTPASINFKNLTDTLGQNIQSWNWEFPGATPSTSNLYQPQNIIYNSINSFNVYLTLVTKKGCTYTKRIDNYLKFADSINLTANFSKTNLCGNEYLLLNLNNARSPDPTVLASPSSVVSTKTSQYNYSFKFTNFGTYSFYISDEINGCKSEKTYVN
ncbi:MAG: PKD domain-containing protein, partial [Bacteroidia bacterium]|nr:PKD domain-containing protein [Bacteroidia bacterium]